MKQDNPAEERNPGSFRDNRGYIFSRNGEIFRRINASGEAGYKKLMESGLYDDLVKAGQLVKHEEIEPGTIKPELVPVISYPYEWSFSQLKDAALLTLAVQQAALKRGLTLRDASAYNVQFVQGRPVLIDTLSFEAYRPGQPWQAYRQFCQHFLAPLALMSLVSLDLLQLMRANIDGIPLGLTAKLLPRRARLNFGLATHVVMHARFQHEHEGKAKKTGAKLSENAQAGLLESLERTVRGLDLPKVQTQWGDYYENTNYSDDAFKEKQRMVGEFLKAVKPARAIDLGANDGSFSRIAAAEGALVLSCDIDPLAVERNYRQVKAGMEAQLLPLLIDLTNPSPGLGWANAERSAFAERAQADVGLALALIHHLVIAANVPIGMVADYFARLVPKLIIEFVPKSDSQVERLLTTREDIFDDYTPEGFEAAFGERFEIKRQEPIAGTTRLLYLMERR
jgi:ribosomal protein L11 methylase PrmA